MMNKLKAKLKKQGGFTLVEMLIVVAIIAILIAVSIPLVSSSLERAREATDQANERSAKGLAEIKYLTAQGAKTGGENDITWTGTDDAKTAVFYYKVTETSGELTQTLPTSADGFNYGQGTKAGDIEEDHAGMYIKITLNADGSCQKPEWVKYTT